MSAATQLLRLVWVQWVLIQVFPSLRVWPVCEWPAVLAAARQQAFDSIESMGTIAGVVISSWLLQPVTAQREDSLFATQIAGFLCAFPLLLLLVSPFYLRCIRRGLSEAAKKRQMSRCDPPRERN